MAVNVLIIQLTNKSVVQQVTVKFYIYKEKNNWHLHLFFVTKPTKCTNFTNKFCHETLYVSDSLSVHHQEFIHCTLNNGIFRMSFRLVDSFRAGPRWNMCMLPDPPILFSLIWSPQNIYCGVQISNLLFMRHYLASCYFPRWVQNIFIIRLFSTSFSLCASFIAETKCHMHGSHKNKRKW